MKMKYLLHTLLLVVMIGCRHLPSADTVKVQAVTTNYIENAIEWSMSDGENEWSECYDTVNFAIQTPPEWAGSNLLVYVSCDETSRALRHSVGATFQFEIRNKHLNHPAGHEVHDDMLYRLRKIK